jgi:hypothetical protein
LEQGFAFLHEGSARVNSFSKQLFDTPRKCNVKKSVEYGQLNLKVEETSLISPSDVIPKLNKTITGNN